MRFEFPYDKTSFKDRYTRQHRRRPCSTIVAHLSKDGLMFIHPTQNRSLTPREAARVQSFPDWFRFPAARTHAFRMIGNAVPPLVGEAVGNAVRAFLTPSETVPALARGAAVGGVTLPFTLPRDRAEAVRWLAPFANPLTDRHALRTLPTRDFLRAWHALLWLFPDLHPGNAVEHGDERHEEPLPAPDVAPLGRERYTRSGWPVMLEGFGREAWRRFEAGDFSADAFYSLEAQKAGIYHRSSSVE